MQLKSLHRILFVFCLFICSFFNVSLILAQSPCVVPPTISSVDSNGTYQTDVICNGNPLVLSTTPLSACPTCTYVWSNGTTGPITFAFTAGLYNVTVTDNAPGGCVRVSTAINIKSSTLAKPIIQGDSFNICNGSPIDLELSNPCVSCSYKWYDGPNPVDSIVGALTTIYSVTVTGEYYAKMTDSLGCTQESRVIVVGNRTVSIPPLTATTLELCDSNSTTMSTINCSGCAYEWHFYDFPDSARLMITGVFARTLTGSQPQGIELYATGNIPDLSKYSVNVAFDGIASAPASAFDFPSVSLAAGSFIYITENDLNFTNFFGFGADYVSPIADIDGNDAIELYYNSSGGPVLVDLYGDRNLVTGPTIYPPSWSYKDGWAYRVDDSSPNPSFSSLDWDIYANKLDSCVTNDSVASYSTCLAGPSSGCCRPFKFGTFTTNILGSNLQVLVGINTHEYMTNITGSYSLQITYPNGCSEESAAILIDTSIFGPKITSEMPDLIGGAISLITSDDTAYLCKGAYVDLYTKAPFLAPPTWSYQWFHNGLPILGAIGYNYRTDTTGFFSVRVTNSQGCISMSNVIRVLKPNNPNIASPFASASSEYLCLGGPLVTLSTTPCVDCRYTWRTENNTNVAGGLSSSLVVNIARGYFVIKTDTLSGCAYSSPIVEIKDTTYPAPLLTTTGNVVCSASPIILSTSPCPACNYIWKLDTNGLFFVTYDSTQQFNNQVNSAGKYRVEILHPNGCRTTFSNTIEATFQTVNAFIAGSSQRSICNGTAEGVKAIPNLTTCPDCEYDFLRNGVAMQPIVPIDSQRITLDGSYQVVVTNAERCADTSSPVVFTAVNIATDIRQSAGKICGPTASVNLEIDSCVGCTYQWYLGTTALGSNKDTFFVATGYAAAAQTYKVQVNKAGCFVRDSVYLDSVQERKIFIEIDSLAFGNQLPSPSICNGSSVFLLDSCEACSNANQYQYQWFFNNDTIAGASFESYQVDTAGLYYVKIVDADNCRATSNQITVQKFTAANGFALDFTPLGPAVPITYGSFNIDTFLRPISLHPKGSYSSLTAGGAISGDWINVGVAGSGRHYITYSYVDSNAQGSCKFSTFDTLEVLGAVAMNVTNTNSNAPPFEACLLDTLVVNITNFTFIPDTVVFVAGGGNTIKIPVTPVVTVFAGVYTGTFKVMVPDGARTGKLTLKNGTSSYQSTNFFVVQNPAVTIALIGTTQPICSNLDTVQFKGEPSGGSFATHYIGYTNNPTLMSDSLLLLNNVSGYVNGVQNLMMMYTYTPTYTGTTIACPAVRDSLLVEVRDSELDSVQYTPIAISQLSEPLANLTRITFPVSARYFPNSYSGTYVIANTLFPSTITTGPGFEYVTYELNNGGCVNSSDDSIQIWKKPAILDSIPKFLCSKEDTVKIYRDTDSLWVTYRGNLIYSDTLYNYYSATKNIGGLVSYTEQFNIMEVTSSGGGLVLNYSNLPNESYDLIPGNVTGGATTLNFKFKYSRTSSFYDPNDPSAPPVVENTDYIIAEVSKLLLIENPSVVAINPVILADTVFCPTNTNYLFLGLPAGGQYYVNGDSVMNNIFNPTSYVSGSSYKLTYVYTGQACVDSAATGIYLPNPFTIRVKPNNGTGLYCKTSPNDSIFFELLPIGSTHPIDTSSSQFFIGGIQSGTIFSPAQVGPPKDYYVQYIVSDSFGCPVSALDTFTVYPIPNLSISPIASTQCLNHDSTQIHLYQTDTAGVVHELTYGGIGYIQGETVTLLGNGLTNAGTNPATPYFFPATAGVGLHRLSYVYADSNSCMDSIIRTVNVLPLPSVSLTTSGGAPLKQYYCENDIVPLFGSPIGTSAISGYGTDTTVLYGNPLINNTYPTSLDSANRLFKPNVAGTLPSTLTEVLFYYYVDNNGCRDTARRTVTIRNFTTDPVISGLPATICASDTALLVLGDPNGTGPSLNSFGWFTSPYLAAFSHLDSVPKTDSTYFYPDSAGIVFAGRNVSVTFHYTDSSGTCFNFVKDSVWVNALPYLTLSETIATSLQTMDRPGNIMVQPASDGYHHICETAPQIPIFAYNTTGLYNPFTGTIILAAPDHISSDTGTYVLGDGIQSNFSPSSIAYGYISANAGFGLDTIRYVYKDARGCIDSIDHYMFIDSLPNLTFAGLSNYNAALDRFVYCEKDSTPPLILPAPIGVDWKLTFNGKPITSVPFQLRPDTLAVPGVWVDYPIQYNYVGQIYANGAVCSDSLFDTIQIRPAPQLAWQSVPTSYCILDSLERLPLSATPYGGIFTDITPGLNGIPGVVADSLFVPSAQPGKRTISYSYYDGNSGCSDRIYHTIYVYSKPRINFAINGGCSGAQVGFIATTAPYGLTYNGVAIDSITQVIWNYGDGAIDTFKNLPNTLVIPNGNHTYNGSGVFFPSLTVVNQGICDTTFTRRIVISPKVTPTALVPYVENFDTPGGWFQESSDTLSQNGIVQDSLWGWGIATGRSINTAAAPGNSVWCTRPDTTYEQGENAWVYSPCFDLKSLERPMIELSLWKNAQSGVDGAVIQYHDNVTNTWKVLGEPGKGIDWYQSGFVVSGPGNQTSTPIGWTGNSTGWQNPRYRLDNIGSDLRQRTDVRFRIAFASDPGTLTGENDGIAFDSIRIGNRTRNVLTEHFSGTGYAGLEPIETQLYHTIFNNLYGRDVSLIQYHTNLHSNDALHLYNPIEARAQVLYYGITAANQVRVDGKNLVANTSTLLNYPQLEFLDVECLEDPKFDLKFIGFPAVAIANGVMAATIKLEALEDLPNGVYSLKVVITEDSLITVTNHRTMAVMREMLPDADGYSYTQPWVTGDNYTINVQWPYNTTTHAKPARLKMTAYMQNVATKEIYQVISSREIVRFKGPVDSLDVSVDNIEDQPGYEVVNLKLYPNPTYDLFNVEFEKALEGDYEWQLFNAIGQVVETGVIREGTTLMQVSAEKLSSGVYIFAIENEHVYTQRKVIVNKP